MEDVILKGLEMGSLGLVTVLLLTKGISALNTLTMAIDKLADKLSAMDSRIENVERGLEEIKRQLLELKVIFAKQSSAE